MKNRNRTRLSVPLKMTIFLFYLLLSKGIIGQNVSVNKSIKITGTRLTYPLIQKWIYEYRKLNPNVDIIVSSKIPADSADILIASHILRSKDLKEGETGIALTRYAQLPIVSNRRSDLAILQSKGFTDASFKQVYFIDNNNVIPNEYRFTVYKREKPACASIAFANHFGNEQKDIKGIGVIGDDKDLLAAVKRDTTAISYNNLGFIYDINTRKLIDSIAIIPIDFNENGKIDEDEKIYKTLDDVINYAESVNSLKMPTENVNAIFYKDIKDKDVASFLEWIITKGQQFNHLYGFLNLDSSTVRTEKLLLSSFIARK